MTFAMLQPYNLRLTLFAPGDDKSTEDLLSFLVDAPRDSILMQLRVDPLHCNRFPRPLVRLFPGRGPRWTVEFCVPEPETEISMAPKLAALFRKNGWETEKVERVEEMPSPTSKPEPDGRLCWIVRHGRRYLSDHSPSGYAPRAEATRYDWEKAQGICCSLNDQADPPFTDAHPMFARAEEVADV